MNNGTVLTTNLLISVFLCGQQRGHRRRGESVGNQLQPARTIDVRRGTLNLLGGLVQADRLFLTNGVLSRLIFSGGRLNSRSTIVNNTQLFTVGSGTNWDGSICWAGPIPSPTVWSFPQMRG